MERTEVECERAGGYYRCVGVPNFTRVGPTQRAPKYSGHFRRMCLTAIPDCALIYTNTVLLLDTVPFRLQYRSGLKGSSHAGVLTFPLRGVVSIHGKLPFAVPFTPRVL